MKTIKETADLFKVCERTIKRWLASGELKAIKIGGTVRIPEEEIVRIKAGVTFASKR